MTCLPAMVTLSLVVVFHFLRRFVPCVLAMVALVHAFRLKISFRTCIQLAIPVLSKMRQASTRPSSILSTFTSVMMSSITVSNDWLSCVSTSSAGNYVGMSSLRLQDNTFLKSPTNLGSHSITNCLLPANPSFTPALRHLYSVFTITSMLYI